MKRARHQQPAGGGPSSDASAAGAAAGAAAAAATAAPPLAEPPAGSDLLSLPDELVSKIVSAAGLESAGAMCLVSKRWRAAVLEEAPELWRRLKLEMSAEAQATEENKEDWLDAKYALLERVGAQVEALSLPHGDAVQAASNKTHRPDRQIVHFLSLLSPGALRELSLTYKGPLSKGIMACLAGFSSLATLSVECGRLPNNTEDILEALPALASLHLEPDNFEADLLLEALPALTRLSHLSLTAMWGALDALPAVAELPALRSLSLNNWAYQDRVVDGEEAQALLEAASKLDSFTCRSRPVPRQWTVLEGGLKASARFTAAPCRPGLQAARCLRHCHPRCLRCLLLSPLRIGEVILQTLSWSKSWEATGKPGTSIRVQRGMPSLRQLLAAALPAALPPLKSLEVQCTTLEPAALAGCSSLAALTTLYLEDVTSSAGLEAALAALLPQAPLLKRLRIVLNGAYRNSGHFRLASIPAAVAAHTGLRKLMIMGHPVTSVTPGPYLAGLQALILVGSSLSRLPALGEAPALTTLCVSTTAKGATLTADGAAALLAATPTLRRLILSSWQATVPVVQALHSRVPALTLEATNIYPV